MIQVVQQGLLDTIQDGGRYGYQHLGINPGGAMDRIALSVANSLVGNDANEAAIEMHFPASAFVFEADALIALSGADFGPTVNGLPISINKPVFISEYSVLRFTRPVSGARCYLAIAGGLSLVPWLNSYSTHLKAEAGGFHGRRLLKGDRLAFREANHYAELLKSRELWTLPWSPDLKGLYTDGNNIRVVDAPVSLAETDFTLTEQCDRMGFRLRGKPLATLHREERLSAGVSRGTIQLLPDGQLIILMADHQTTGGYDRIGHVITADLPSLSQLSPNQKIQFREVTHEIAVALFKEQDRHLQLLQNACKLRLEDWLRHQ
jgi:antagonist of KipI